LLAECGAEPLEEFLAGGGIFGARVCALGGEFRTEERLQDSGGFGTVDGRLVALADGEEEDSRESDNGESECGGGNRVHRKSKE
jgi:hypothetical protein